MKSLEKNELKEDLRKRSEVRRADLESELKSLGDRTEKVLVNVLIVSGALALSYLLFRQFVPSKSKSKLRKKKLAHAGDQWEEEDERGDSVLSSIVSEVGVVLASQVAAFLLEVAREKLKEYLETQTAKKKAADEHS